MAAHMAARSSPGNSLRFQLWTPAATSGCKAGQQQGQQDKHGQWRQQPLGRGQQLQEEEGQGWL
jgi:hypothetical protein